MGASLRSLVGSSGARLSTPTEECVEGRSELSTQGQPRSMYLLASRLIGWELPYPWFGHTCLMSEVLPTSQMSEKHQTSKCKTTLGTSGKRPSVPG